MTIRFLASPLAAAHWIVVFGLGGLGADHAFAAERNFRAEVVFRLANPCPATGETRGACRGYVIDRVVPHVCGGAEEPANMRWLTVAEAQAKSRWDRIGCRPGRKLVLPGGPSFTEAYAIDAPEPPVDAQALPE
jgi:hypothetical protein